MVLVAEGVGTGIVFDGQVYKGERGAAGEFGHMIIGQKGLVACSCGNYDCWEAFVSEHAAIARYQELIDVDAAASVPSFSQLTDCALSLAPRAKVCLYLRGIKTDLEFKVGSLQLTIAKSASLKGGIE